MFEVLGFFNALPNNLWQKKIGFFSEIRTSLGMFLSMSRFGLFTAYKTFSIQQPGQLELTWI
jgi:hypothetical protein